jgi:ribosomal protein S18 acetylase RimI-like enzyme
MLAEKPPWVYQKGVLWALELPKAIGGEVFRSKSVAPRIAATFEEAYTPDAESMAKAMDLSNPEQIIRRLSPKRRCFVAKVVGVIAAYGWVSIRTECVGEMERQIRLQPDEAYVWDCATLPAYRRQRLYSALLSHINNTLAKEGFRRIWIGSNLENRPSLKGFDNAGYQPAALITRFRIFDLNCLWVRSFRQAPKHLTRAAQDVFSMKSDRKLGPLVFGRLKPSDLSACIELED